jgi:hypothetical protein
LIAFSDSPSALAGINPNTGVLWAFIFAALTIVLIYKKQQESAKGIHGSGSPTSPGSLASGQWWVPWLRTSEPLYVARINPSRDVSASSFAKPLFLHQ